MAKRRASAKRGTPEIRIQLSPIGDKIDAVIGQLSAAAKKPGVTPTAARRVRQTIRRLRMAKLGVKAQCRTWTLRIAREPR